MSKHRCKPCREPQLRTGSCHYRLALCHSKGGVQSYWVLESTFASLDDLLSHFGTLRSVCKSKFVLPKRLTLEGRTEASRI